MTGVVNTFWKGASKIWNSVFGGIEELRLGEDTRLHTTPPKPRMPTPESPRRAPTLDDASMRQQESDRLRRRRGVLANVFGGGTNAAPTVATKTLLGS